MIDVVRRAGVVLVALLMMLAMSVGLPGTSPSLTRAAQADGRHDYSYGSCYWEHGYWHCRGGDGDWWWYSGRDKCHSHDKWYCWGDRRNGRDEHGHGGGGY